MNSSNKNDAIDNLRALVLTLDLRLGIDARKQILAGNEKITLSTDERGWVAWMSGVETRLKEIAGTQMVGEVLANHWWSSTTQKNQEK